MEAVDSAALELVQGKYRPRASFYLDSYISLRGRTDDRKFINDAKRNVEDAYEWNALGTTVNITTTCGTYSYALTGAGQKFRV